MMIMKRWNGFCYGVSRQDDDYLELGTRGWLRFVGNREEQRHLFYFLLLLLFF